MSNFEPTFEALEKIRTLALEYSDVGLAHKDDCAGSLCLDCGHCLHSVVSCDHECDPDGGCANAGEDDEIRLKRATLAMVDALTSIVRIVETSETTPGPYRNVLHASQISGAWDDLTKVTNF